MVDAKKNIGKKNEQTQNICVNLFKKINCWKNIGGNTICSMTAKVRM